MVIENEVYKIIITIDETFTLNSTDNKPYEHIFNPSNLNCSNFYKIFSINIDDDNQKKHIGLIGSGYATVENTAVLENNDLIVLMNTTLTVIDCCTLVLKLHKTISDCGMFFSIYKFENGYIVYGELDVLKLSSDFEIEWMFSGAEIFVQEDGSNSFYIEKDIIHLLDWEGRKYTLNKFGEEITK